MKVVVKPKPIVLLTGCLLFSIALVSVLYALSDKNAPERNISCQKLSACYHKKK